MNNIAKLFYDINEPYAAGLFEEPERGLFYRHCLALKRYYEALPVSAYRDGALLYPCGKEFLSQSYAVVTNYGNTFYADRVKLKEKSEEAEAIFAKFEEKCHNPGVWAHAAGNYKRIVREGLSSYRERCREHEGSEFHEGLILLLDAFEGYPGR